MEIGSQSKSDNQFTKKYRLIQSKYRAEILKVPCGVGPTKNSDKTYGNMLSNGEQSGLNFISKNAFEFAKQKNLDKQINPDLTIDEFRLFNNMLSSMPMCFNLFGDLRALLLHDQKAVSKVIKEMFQEINWISKVKYIDVEFIPVPIGNYTNDKSAFDAMILVEDENGKKGLISIETKYTDLLGSNTSKNTELKDEIITKNKIFNNSYTKSLLENGYQQLHRNYLLTYAYAKKHNFKHFSNVVVSPADDKLSLEEIDLMKKNLLLKEETIFKISLEDIVERAIKANLPEVSEIMIKFKQRYF